MHRRRFLQVSSIALANAAYVDAQEGTDPLRAMYQPAAPAVQEGLTYLTKEQSTAALPGAFGTGDWSGNVAITGLAALAFLAGGHHPQRGPHGAVVEKATAYVVSQAQPDGLLYNARSQPKGGLWMYSHGFGTLFLAEVYGTPLGADLSKQVLQTLKRAVDLILRTQNRQGGWRYEAEAVRQADLSVTVAQVMALRAARNLGLPVPDAAFQRSQEYMLRCQEMPGGGFRYQPDDSYPSFPMTGAGLAGLHCCGVYQGRAVDRARDYLLTFRPDQVTGGTIHPDYFLYGHYYAALAMYQAPPRLWLPWYKAVRDELLRPDTSKPSNPTPHRRQLSGFWHDPRQSPHLATALALLILQLPLNCLPIFQK
jgi:hypothetical protein